MLGFDGAGVYLAYVFSILAMILCVVYGIMNWNKAGKDEPRQIEEEITWEKKEDEIAKKS